MTRTVAKESSILAGTSRLLKVVRWQIQEDYQKDLFLLVVFGVSAFYYAALTTFTPLDPSWISASFPRIAVNNIAGQVGANISALALAVLGVAAYILPLPGMLAATLMVTKVDLMQSKARYFGWLILTLATATLASLHLQPIVFDEYPMPSGGMIGSFLASALENNLGRLGSKIFYVTAAAMALILITKAAVLSSALGSILGFFRKMLKRSKDKIRWFPRPKPAADPISYEPFSLSVTATEAPMPEPIPSQFFQNLAPLDDGFRREPAVTYSQPKPESAPRITVSNLANNYAPPPVSTFKKSDQRTRLNLSKSELDQVSNMIESTLADFGIAGKIIGYQSGPVVTVYEFQPDAGIKQSRIMGLIDDLALCLKVDSIFIHPVKGKRALGIQVPNSKRETVYLGDLLESSAFLEAKSPLTFVMGKSLTGEPVCANLAETPHVLIAGSTGSGKSVGINTLLCSLIMKSSPQDVRMILVDPKMLELSVYEGIPHLLMPVITDPNKANLALRWAVTEMERRYRLMQAVSVRNIEAFNSMWHGADANKRNEIRQLVDDREVSHLPFVVLVIDELADLMLTAPKEIETIIQRLAQKARASGIHLVLATQRPSVDIITGVIKANLPTRIAFQVVAKHDSRTILDQMGADKLLGKGDMLFQRPGVASLERIQGAFVSDDEVVSLVSQIKAREKSAYDSKLISWIEDEATKQSDDSTLAADLPADDDPKWDEAITIAQSQGAISASFLQRQLKIGYNRAARIVEAMEKQGLVDRADGAKPRRWLGPRAAADI